MPVFINPLGHRDPFGKLPEVTVDFGWPEPHLIARPGDTQGEAIIEFANQYRDHPEVQSGPWDDRTGTINLIRPNEKRPATDEVPRWKLKLAGYVGAALYPAGALLEHPHWPQSL